MTSRKRKNTSSVSSNTRDARSLSKGRPEGRKLSRTKRRRHLLETLEPRQLLAGPQLIGIQPNVGELIVEGSTVGTAPRALTLRFDQDQSIDPATFDAVKISRAGDDGQLGTTDDVVIRPDLISLADDAENEVIVRFSGALPDDDYKVEVFGYDDPSKEIVGLRNTQNELLQPRELGQRLDSTSFQLKLGALIEAVVPQPVIRQPDGTLRQNRDEIVVYFNEDPMFVENYVPQGDIASAVTNGSGKVVFRTELSESRELRVGDQLSISDTGTAYDTTHVVTAVTNVSGQTYDIETSIDFVVDATGSWELEGTRPTIRSAEHPRFYQLFLTQGTVRNTDDALYHPEQVFYDEATHTARLIFSGDLNSLGPDLDGNAGVPLEGGAFRLRIGTAVDNRLDVILPPTQTAVIASAVVDFGVEGLSLRFVENSGVGEGSTGRQISFVDNGGGSLSHTLDAAPLGSLVFDLGGTTPSVQDLINYIEDPANSLDGEVGLAATPQNLADLSATTLPERLIDAPAFTLVAVGDTLQQALDVGVFGQGGELTTLQLSESIDPQTVVIQPVGSNTDPGSNERFSHFNPDFGADVTAGVTEIAYNFNGIYATDPDTGTDFLNQITEVQKTRIRETLDLWSSKIGVQFRETSSDGIMFAVGDPAKVETAPSADLTNLGVLDAVLRIPNDPNNVGYGEAAMVFSNAVEFQVDYGEDFTRKTVAGIGLLLGLERASDLLSTSDAGDSTVRGDATNTIMGLSSSFLNASIESLSDLEPVFPGNYDVLHAQYLHRPDSVDVDLFRFVVDLDDPTQVGTLTAETFSERLSSPSLLDTELTLFQEVSASITTDFGLGLDMAMRIDSLMPGRLGNNASISFVQSDRELGDTDIKILRSLDLLGNPSPNGILVDLPRLGDNVSEVLVGDLVEVINDDPFASSIFRASMASGDPGTDIGDADLTTFAPLLLSGGGLEKVHRNDDYFGEDSRIIASLGEGVYYLGVAASGNDQYDPTISGTGNGGRTQGDYDLHLKFEPQVDELDVLRDQDSTRSDVPGTAIDGDGDGVPGGVHNFWFETRALQRMVTVEGDGQRAVDGQVMTITSGSGVIRNYEFADVTLTGGPGTGTVAPGNIKVEFNNADTTLDIADQLADAIDEQLGSTGVEVEVDDSGPVPVLKFSGERSVELSADFDGMEIIGRTIFVDKLSTPFAQGTLDSPFNNISNSNVANAFGSAAYGDIVRIIGNGGLDNDITTEDDNLSYQLGTAETGGDALPDGRSMNVPEGVITMIDAGAIFKLRNSYINVGSSTVQVDRSNSALQVLGTPRLVELSVSDDPVTTTLLGNDDVVAAEGYSDGSVIFTSTRDRMVDEAASGISPEPAPGNWGGIIFRRDIDRAEGRRDREDDGIFLQTVNHAELRYGGSSNVLIDSVQQLVNPIQIVDMRPTVSFNQITFSADSAISAAPNSFEETSFQAPTYQRGGAFTADYDRVGPDIHSNLIVENSINGLFIRVTTTPVDPPKEFTVSARFDDTDVVHYVAENLSVVGSPGGSIEDEVVPSWRNVTWQSLSGGSLTGGNTYEYKLTFVDADGFESAASDPFSITVDAGFPEASVELTSLETVGGLSEYVSRRLYRADPSDPGEFYLIAELDAGSVDFIDNGSRQDAFLDPAHDGIRGRLNASLVMDAGLIMKLRGARIELGHGTQLLAEADETNPIVFTSSLDDRFGAGGSFDTNNDGSSTGPDRGDWSGIYASPNSNLSFDHVLLANAGGISLLRGGLARGFAPVELTQAEARITNSRFESNDTGQDGAGPAGRFGLLSLNGVQVGDPADPRHVRDAISTILVRGSQPVIVGNTFYDNRGTIINIDVESMGANHRVDPGRSTGDIDRFSGLDDNFGPLIRYNRYENVVASSIDRNDNNSQLSGLEIRGGHITTETIFDDTDIAHLLFDHIEVGNFESSGGLILKSRPDESLVVKFSGPGTPNSANEGTGITASGKQGDSARIGGTVHVLGLPGAPVVLTSIHDDAVGAGMSPDGSSFGDHDGDGVASRPQPNDWRGIYLDEFSNDTNLLVLPELELLTEVPPGLNSTVDNAQYLGELSSDAFTADHARRAGFEVHGYLGGFTDIDAYSFTASPGTPVWVDIDATTFTLDTVIEILDANGTVLARSDNSFDETAEVNPADVSVFDSSLEQDGVISSLQAEPEFYTDRNDFGLYSDFGSYNTRDAGIHLSLPGNTTDPSARSVYFLRVRSASLNPDDAAGGITGGHYRMQLRLTEEQAFPGSLVRFADIRYANHGIHAQGLMSSSPLLGEARENEVRVQAEFSPIVPLLPSSGYQAYNNVPVGSSVGSGAQYLGNLSSSQRGVLSVGGTLGHPGNGNPTQYDADDVDFYQIDVDGSQSVVFDVDFADGFNRYDTNISIFFDEDGAPQAGDLDSKAPRLIFFGSASNVLEDLPSALGADSELEQLVRGSLTTNDPFVGPVTLVEGDVPVGLGGANRTRGVGTYYVAITEGDRQPSSLTNDNVVREPINSVTRLVEDRFDDQASTVIDANSITVHDLFVPTEPGFGIGDDNDFGHGIPAGFVTTTVPNPSGAGETRVNRYHLPPLTLGLAGLSEDSHPEFPATGLVEYDPDDPEVTPPDNLDNPLFFQWSLRERDTIGGPATSLGGSENTSTTIPHISLRGNLGTVNFYQISLGNPINELTIDIDNGHEAGLQSIDTKYAIFPLSGGGAVLGGDISTQPLGPPFDAFTGNSGSEFVEDGMQGSVSPRDPFQQEILPAGNYLIAVVGQESTFNVTVAADGDPGEITVTSDGQTGDYILRLSTEGKTDTVGPWEIDTQRDNLFLEFDRNAIDPGTGAVLAAGSYEQTAAELIDLSGYTAADQPFLYFNRLLDLGNNDSASFTLVSDQSPIVDLSPVYESADNSGWTQERIDLAAFAGHTNVQLGITYTKGAGGGDGGLGIDDIIVGFAERGEQIFRAASGTQFEDINPFNSSQPISKGEYQLEIRPATEFSTGVEVLATRTVINPLTGQPIEDPDTGEVIEFPWTLPTDFESPLRNESQITLTSNFDTNDRWTKAVSMVVPDLGDIEDGDTFWLSDGVSTQVFEFSEDNDVEFGNIRIDIDPLLVTTTPELAGAIRDAINGQSRIAVEATTSGGLDTQAPTGNRLALSGAKLGSFEDVQVSGVPSPLNTDGSDDDHLLMPVIFHDAFGDSNFARNQGVVLIEHNQISDVQGIGIWSEPGIRESSPYQDLNDPFVVSPLLEMFYDDLGLPQTSNEPRDLYFAPKTANANPGGVINFPEANDHVLGGLAPGIVIQSNTIDQASYAGIKVDGQTVPWVIEAPSGDSVADGSTFVIDAAGTRVVFEFEDIGDGSDTEPIPGSGEQGGDGVKDGHVPVYYRHTDDEANELYLGRELEYSSLEMVHAIREAIQGSILMTNGLAELVEVTVGPSLTALPHTASGSIAPALYIQGATAIYPGVLGGIPDVTAPINAYQAPVSEAAQPFARIVNNTIFGDDGTRTATKGSAAEPNDLFVNAVDTRISGSHRDEYTVAAVIGDNGGQQASSTDVDFYRVHLEVGDRLAIDIDTNGNPDTSLQIFDANGSAQSFVDSDGETRTISSNDVAPGTLIGNAEPGNNVDPFIDFVAPKTGVYFVGVSSEGNDTYSGRTLANRKDGFGGTGNYNLTMKAFAPRSFVMSFDGNAPSPNGLDEADRDQAAVESLAGATFTVTTIEDGVAGTNQVLFQFTGGNDVTFNNGVVGVPIGSGEVPDLMKGIEAAINFEVADIPVLSNYDFSSFPEIQPGAVRPAAAKALGGVSGQTQIGDELPNYFWEPTLIIPPYGIPFDNNVIHPETFEFTGMGHNNANSPTDGSTELYTLINNVSAIELSPAAIAAGLKLDPIAGEDADQLLNETGVMITGGASPTVLNNVFMNLHEAVAVESSNGLLGLSPGRQHVKPMEVIVVGNVFQDNFLDDATETNAQSTIGVRHRSLTGSFNGTSNVNGGSDDFNVTLNSSDLSLQHPEANNFQPAYGSVIIDSSVNSLTERDQYAEVRISAGLGVTNILAPTSDVSGVLRADHPDFASFGGIGSSVFKDRGSVELADFVGPIAIAEMPRDNDAAGIDADSTVSVINLNEGTYKEFRIQLRDNGDSSDPFTGIGIDSSTVVVPVIEGLRPAGSNVTLLENDRLLTEGIDYTFFYDETRKLITLTPLTGVWQNDRSYRIEINNQDRNVLVAPSASTVTDGDQLAIFDSRGGEIIFEFESGYSLFVPEPITLVVPRAGTDIGGLSDGDLFQVNDGLNIPVIFEFNTDGGSTLPGTIPITLPTQPTPGDEASLQIFLNEIAENISAAIQTKIDDDSLDIDVRVIGDRVVVGAEPGATVVTALSGLNQLSRTLALQVPQVGVGPGGIVDGDSFRIGNGSDNSIGFEFDTVGNGVSSVQNRLVDVTGASTPEEIAAVIREAVAASGLGLDPVVEGDGKTVYLNLPVNGTASVVSGRLDVVGLSRTPIDGDTITVTPTDDSGSVILEINRTDEPDVDGLTTDDGVEEGNFGVDITRTTSADEFSALIANRMQSLTAIEGLNQEQITVIPGGLLSVGGEEGLGLETDGYSMSVSGSPSVTGPSTVSINGPLILSLPLVGGGGIIDGSVLVLTDDLGNDVVFEFNEASSAPTYPGSIPVLYNVSDAVNIVVDSLVAAINAAGIGITATGQASGQVSLGRIAEDRVNINGIFDPTGAVTSAPGLANTTLRRDIVRDGEVLEVTQGTTTVRYEFETASGGGGVAPGNVAVPFQPGSTPADVALSLAAAINNSPNGLSINAVVVLDPSTEEPTGSVTLNDVPGTVVNITAAPTLELSGVPGGATPIQYSPSFGSIEMKFAMINAINSVNTPGEPAVTTITADDRGGSTLFVSNAEFFAGVADLDGYVANFFLPGVKDEAGNLLKANRSDLTTQFTILMPTALFDYGDAPDPLNGVAGRYPTKSVNNGPRHVVGGRLKLGSKVDSNPNGLPGLSALGDDVTIGITSEGSLFDTSFNNGRAEILIDVSAVDPLTRDGDTITIDLGTVQSTLEFNVRNINTGAFDEDNYSITPVDPESPASIAEALRQAIIESPLQPADISIETISEDEVLVTVGTDDEDGVTFVSEENPYGVLNRGVALPIDVSVTGGGVLEAWIDFNADGDWDDPGEQIIPQPNTASFQAIRNELLPPELQGVVSNVFSDTGGVSTRTFGVVVPDTVPNPPTAVTTYARFRVSQEGGLTPEGLALSGEVEDYAIQILPGLPPSITDEQSLLSYSATEDTTLDVSDANLGLLNGISDPDGDDVAIFAGDVGSQVVSDASGENAGEVTINADGTFTYVPADDYFGTFTFTARVTDIHPGSPETQLVSPKALNVTVTVDPVNDKPILIDEVNSPALVEETINEDEVYDFTNLDLIDPFFQPGPSNESDQGLVFSRAFYAALDNESKEGGSLVVEDDRIIYTPPADHFGTDEFSYTVKDSFDETSDPISGTVTINLNAVNDPPRPGDDTVLTQENVSATIAIATLLSNDDAGPANEVGQTIEFISFDAQSAQGGTVVRVDDNLIYTPVDQFSGADSFTYRIAEVGNASSFADGTVNVTVEPVNDPPLFIGKDGVLGYTAEDDLSFEESKATPQTFNYDLNDWFTEPDGEAMTFTVSSSDPVAVDASIVNGNTLQIVLPSYAGSDTPFNLTLTASDSSNPPTTISQTIQVVVDDTPDAPQLDNPIGTITVDEDTPEVSVDMSGVFSDPDGDALQYSVTQLGDLENPTAGEIAQHPFVESIAFPAGNMRIVLKGDGNGTTNIVIAATDGTSSVTDAFTLTVTPVDDDPIANDDTYSVGLGSSLSIQDAQAGLLANDDDPDGDAILVDVQTVILPTKGDLTYNAEGLFVYTNDSGQVGDTDQFSYRVTDGTRFSDFATVTINLTASSYQNPLLRADVNGDGQVSAIDALRVINFLNRNLNGNATSVPVSDIGSAPPDYLDVNGNGSVSAGDALVVINELATLNNGSGELIVPFGTTTAYAASDQTGVQSRNFDIVESSTEEQVDEIFAGSVSVESTPNREGFDWFFGSADDQAAAPASSDEALSSLLEDHDLQSDI